MYQAELYGQWLKAAQALGGGKGDVLIRPDEQRLQRTSVLGSVAQVKERISEILDSTPLTELIVVMQLPGLDPAKTRRSLERFAADVLPAIKSAKS